MSPRCGLQHFSPYTNLVSWLEIGSKSLESFTMHPHITNVNVGAWNYDARPLTVRHFLSSARSVPHPSWHCYMLQLLSPTSYNTPFQQPSWKCVMYGPHSFSVDVLCNPEDCSPDQKFQTHQFCLPYALGEDVSLFKVFFLMSGFQILVSCEHSNINT